MKGILYIITLSFFLTGYAVAQSVIVNADGTHSTVINNGSTSTIVNSDGSHSTVINNGNSSVIVNSNGTHSTVINNGNTSTIVNPDGSHSTVIKNGNTAVIVNPDGTHSTMINNGNISTIVNSDGAHSTIINTEDKSSAVKTQSTKTSVTFNENVNENEIIAPSVSFNTAKLDSLFTFLQKNDKGMGSVSVFKNGREVYQRTYGYANVEKKIKPDTRTLYRIGSITKMFTATIIMKLVEQGKLSLDTKLSTFYPQIKNADKITVAQLLQHRSGIFNFTAGKDYLSWNTTYHFKQMLLDKFATLKSNFEPGSKYEYSNTNYVLLSFIAEDASGKPFAQLLDDIIIKPCKLKHTRIFDSIAIKDHEASSYSYRNGWVPERETDSSVTLGAGFLASTARDLNKFCLCLFDGKIVKSESVKKMMEIKEGYGLGLGSYHFGDTPGYGHNGGMDGFQSTLSYFPNLGISLAIVSNGVVYPLNDISVGILSIFTEDNSYKLPDFK